MPRVEGKEFKTASFKLFKINDAHKTDELPIESFEYDLIVKIKKLTGNIKKIGIVEGSGSNKYVLTLPGNPPQPQQGFDALFPSLKTEIEKLYTISFQNPEKKKIDSDIDLLLVAAPKKLSEVEKFHIDQFLMQGKSVIFLTPGVNVNFQQGLNGQAAINEYEGLLNHYGISVKKIGPLGPG